MKEKNCKTCKFGKDMKYRQRLCRRRNEMQPELYSCPDYVERRLEKTAVKDGRN
jgi:hypothetical protein